MNKSVSNAVKSLKLEHTYTKLPSALFSTQKPIPVSSPQMVCFNDTLAQNLGLDVLKNHPAEAVQILSGNKTIADSNPIAQAYAGHQFGHFTMLGDGRAVLLGEHITLSGNRIDIQLKGSGRTPYSRHGDGRATLYSMLREYLISEAMHHLEIPTSRSLAVVSTGGEVQREIMHDGAVLTRIADSHIRVGTFQFARNFRPQEELKSLAEYTIARHFPEKVNAKNPTLELLKSVMHSQIDLIVNWMRVGFIHGVMNTDNMSIAGQTIDYGPCAFMNAYHPKTVFSSIDRGGRYSFGNQSMIAYWNLTAFANAILPLISETPQEGIDQAQEVLDGFKFKFQKRWYKMMFRKLGIPQPKEEYKSIIDRLLALMEKYRADYTQTFLAVQYHEFPQEPLYQSEEFKQWHQDWKNAIPSELKEESQKLMNQNNPKVIPRNHWVEEALSQAANGNMKPFHELLSLLSNPYGDVLKEKSFEPIPEAFDASYQTFCGT